MDSKLLLILCLVLHGNQSIQDLDVRERQILPCSFERPSSKSSQWMMGAEDTKLQAWLVFRRSPGSFNEEDTLFIVKDSLLQWRLFLNEITDKLVCNIKKYFTDNIQILWPGIQTKDNTMDSWFICTIKHTNNHFHLTVFFVRLSDKQLMEENVSSEDNRTLNVSATFMLSTQTPLVQTKLNGNVLLDCGFSVDHPADVTIIWTLKRKGVLKHDILSYDGARNIIDYKIKGIVMKKEEIPKGNASLLLTNVNMDTEGLYSCSVSASSFYADQDIHVHIIESPTVTLNADSLLLEEGQEQKLLCDASNYYPLDVTIEWVREQSSQQLIPTVVKHVLLSSHKYNSNGTYSLAGFFMLTATLQDNGAMFTCRVDHTSLKQPIRRRLRITVKLSRRVCLNYFPSNSI
ncbi:tapasin-related protein-like isoform 2-T2 [Discoglossus pictus]